MAARREFSRKLRAEIVLRATRDGVVCCEGCGLVLGKKRYEIDHRIAEALIVDKTRELTAADGQLLGRDCCHRAPGGKTAQDVARIAKAKRQGDRDSGAMLPAKVKIPTRPKISRPKRDQLPPPARRPLFWPVRHIPDSGD